ncbi:dihydropteroate synthase [Aquabacterium sp.]|uniref:dihydropteroate synthase n=1 Tax=Aquabacterium sp. TaxID=1872578 RepID=UPI002E35453E|nr:dihydropteroate synthase [Aquabacterium sp.]HEX5312309.1 dihydropteroate synthase [Aquabacterium sp.]
MSIWQTSRFHLDLARPLIMGIVNVTPDSFSDGGRFLSADSALAQCERLIQEGADILDIGGESSRPGAPTLTVEEEWQRLEGVLKVAVSLGVPVSVDTCKTEVMRRALDLGVDIINDIRALEAPGAVDLIASHGQCGVCLMHMQGDPATMQARPCYPDVVDEVRQYLSQRLDSLRQAGVAEARITLDPGIGFGKTPAHNIELLKRQAELLDLGRPLLLGWSRKSTLGQITGKPVEERLVASVAAALAAVTRGARIVRVHDVGATADALKVWQASNLCNSHI